MAKNTGTYNKSDFFNNWEEVNKTLAKRWDEVVKASPHKQIAKPTLSDLYFVQSIVGLLKIYLPDKTGFKVLKYDLYNEAMSTTTLADWFLQQGYDYYGVDISPEVVRLAKKNFKSKTDTAKFLIGDVRCLPFPDNYFDIVFSYGTIEHIREHQQAVKEAFRVLTPGGIFISGVNNKLDMWLAYFVNELLNRVLKNITSYEPSFFPWEQKKWLEQAGFDNIKITGMIIFPRLARYMDLLMEYKSVGGIWRLIWDNAIIRPLVLLASLLDRSSLMRLFSLQTVSIGYKPKLKNK